MVRSIPDLLAEVRRTPGSHVEPACGFPELPAGMSLPFDLQEFYEVAGGATLHSHYVCGGQIRILPPAEFQRIDLTITGDLFATGPFPWWYAIADVEDGNYVGIDLNAEHLGLCYDAFHATFALPGYVSVVATSFSDFLTRILAHRDDSTYWLQDGFESLGEAFAVYGYEPLPGSGG